MTIKKRGLGRGLEVLLAEDSGKVIDESLSLATKTDDRRKEHHCLQEEAEDLKKLIDEIESIVRDDNL